MNRRPPDTGSHPSVRADTPRGVILVIVAGIIIVVAFAIIPFLLQVFSPQPIVTLSGITPTVTGCTSTQRYYTYSWQFTLTNTGNVNANVTVAVVPHNRITYGLSPLTTKVYTIPKATMVPVNISISLIQAGCSQQETLDIQIIQTVRA